MLKHKDGTIRPMQVYKLYLRTSNLSVLADILDQEEPRPSLSRLVNDLIAEYIAKHGDGEGKDE